MLHLTDLGDLGDLADASGYKQMWKNPGFPGKSSTLQVGFPNLSFQEGTLLTGRNCLKR